MTFLQTQYILYMHVQLHYRPTTLLNKHAPIVTKRVEINNLNGIIQKFSMPDK
jgi:hypothetical protein